MASAAVATPASAAKAQQDKEAVEKQRRENEDAVAKFFKSNPAYTEIAYKPSTVVNMLWAELDAVLELAFTVQDKAENATRFRVDFILKAVKSQTKVEARSRVSEFEREIDAWSKEHTAVQISREEIAQEVISATRSGRRMAEMAAVGKAYIATVK